jgi:hypothetical protein
MLYVLQDLIIKPQTNPLIIGLWVRGPCYLSALFIMSLALLRPLRMLEAYSLCFAAAEADNLLPIMTPPVSAAISPPW